ncbi:MAG: putative sulfate exporter family transporter [Alphaproteobacteria bacterium]|nr:putative sulfate exporter family transporter [Alphaproteobacteria bacterium]
MISLAPTIMLIGIIFAMSSWGSAALALLAGVAIALTVGNPYADKTKPLAQKLLSYSIIGLGAGMNLIAVGKAGLSGLGMTIVSIGATLTLGLVLGRLLKAEKETSILIAVGTAICGGSAIAAIAPVMKAKPHAITVSLGTVFLLNAVALMIFPTLGHLVGLSQEQFGIWSALAIHDTSSVVGAGLQYGPEALQTGVTIKLARALWIVPLTMGFGYFYRDIAAEHGGKAKKPWFILGFLLTAALVTWVPALQDAGHIVEQVARKGLVVTLFLIGANLGRKTLQEVGIRPLLQGVILWLIVSVVTLTVIRLTIPT